MSRLLDFIQNKNGVSFPFNLDGQTRTVSGIDYIRQGLLVKIKEVFFERLMRPEGSDLHLYIFENITPALHDAIAISVRQALSSYSPITVRSVYVYSEPDNHIVNVRVTYSLRESVIEDVVEYSMTLRGDNNE
jgi:phage baseplate assembly protein W